MNMGWFHDFNLKRKIVGALTDQREMGLSLEEISNITQERPDEVERQLALMEAKGFALRERRAGLEVFRLNREAPTVAKIMNVMEPRQEWEEIHGYRMDFRITEDSRWEAQVKDLPGMPFLGRTKAEASANALQMARRLAPRGSEAE